MRIDLILERDRFIPGWHIQPELPRAEEFPPEWRWQGRIPSAVRALLGSLLEACYAIHPQHCWTARGHVPGDSSQAVPPGKQARWSVASLAQRWSARAPQLRSGGRRQEKEETC
jgi:hypothetical protein